MAKYNGGEAHYDAKLTHDIVTKLRLGELSLSQAAKLSGCSKVACFKARTGETWSTNPPPPKEAWT